MQLKIEQLFLKDRFVTIMGIRHLNYYLRTHCKNAIKGMHLSSLAGKCIAVDTSIYLYKFDTDGNLMENMYVMLSIFKHHRISPIFVFDGKPPPEKMSIIMQRKAERKSAEEEFNRMQEQVNAGEIVNEQEMLRLKKLKVQTNKYRIDKVKQLIAAHGFDCFNSPSEADEQCVQLVLNGTAWACLTDDMDMFAYGCPRVLRCLNLATHSAVLYDMQQILSSLQLTQQEFTNICVMSGTDYTNNADVSYSNIEENVAKLAEFKQSKESSYSSFYEWLGVYYHMNVDALNKINDMFSLQIVDNKNLISPGEMNSDVIKQLMSDENFLFV